MKKTILLATNPFNFRPVINIIIAVLGSIIFIFGGIRYLTHNSSFEIFLGIGWLVVGIRYLAHGFIMSNPSSKFAPRFSISENELLFKETLMKPSIQVPWDKINKIQFGQYRLDVSTKDSDLSLGYLTNPDVSKRIKSAIREIAESKQIEVIGG